MNNKVRYLDFLKHKNSVKVVFPQKLDPTEDTLIESLSHAWSSGGKIRVMEFMHADHGLSPSTVHRRLKSLRKKGFINLGVDEVDCRNKYIEPTPLLWDLFDKLGSGLSI